MKNRWLQKTLADVCDISSALVDPRETRYQPLLHVGGANIESTTGRLLDLRTAKDEGLISGKFYFDENAVLYSKIRPYLMKVARPDFRGFCSADIYPLVPREGLLDRGFLYYLLLTKDFTDFAVVGSARAGMPKVNRGHLFAYTFSVPPVPEQQRIARILDEAYKAFATAKANAEKNLHNARALFESHLQSVFTHHGPGWVHKRLAEVSREFGRGKSKHRPRNAPHLYGGKYPFVQTGDIRNADHIISEYSKTYSEAGLAQSKLWPKETICITIAANIAETAILAFDACFPDSVIGVVANPKEADVGFIEYLLQSSKARLQAMGKGSAQANINMGTFENERFPFPPILEQRKIVAELDHLREETQRLAALYERKLAALEVLNKSLLHQAFTGQL
jgi:type I restriction enzyme, S subunit